MINPEEIVLDYKPRYDERSRDYRLTASDQYENEYVYRIPNRLILDQGTEGACVGHACTNAMINSPHRLKLPDPQKSAFGVYHLARYLDSWIGENYEGTSILAGMNVLHEMGLIKSYNWCFNTSEIITALHEVGPVVIGIPWYSGMYNTDERGYVDISGEEVGGHALLVYAYHPRKLNYATGEKEQYFYWRNSWTAEYGNKGSGYIRRSDLEKLLGEFGEAAVPVT